LAVNEHPYLDNYVVVFPNPSNSLIKVKSDQQITRMNLCNSIGQCIDSTTESFIDIAKHSNGIYYLKIETASGFIMVEKVIKS
jgi:hypothetical protein